MTKNYEKEIEAICGQLTLKEKTDLIHGGGLFRTGRVERLGIPAVKMSDGPMGVREEFADAAWRAVGNNDDYVTYGPSNSAVASTWNPERAYRSGKTLGEETRGRGKDVILAPGINIKRDPLCGRNFEYMSEDPYLTQTMAVPFIKGVQENDVAACVKHFAVNNQETNRLQVDTIVDERTLREIYLPAFKAAIEDGNVYSLMNAYNRVRGIHCSENKELLDDILREEWNYDGTVISDWGSVHTTVPTAKASMDVEMSVFSNFNEYFLADPLIKAVEEGEVSIENVDKKVKNVLRMMYRLKMLGPETKDRKSGCYNTREHQDSTLDTAREGIILLKNEENVLPLTKERVSVGKKIAVIGVNAACQHAHGGGSAEIKALYEITPLMGLKKILGGDVEVCYAPGYDIPKKEELSEVNWQESSLDEVQDNDTQNTGNQSKDVVATTKNLVQEKADELLKEACELAKMCDEVIFVGGLNHDFDMEGIDRKDMKLPYGQDKVIEELLKINSNSIVVMVAGSPVEMPWMQTTKAVVWSYYSGMETGTALAEILLGQTNPSGKLAETFPKVYTDTVTYKNGQFGLKERVEYKEGIFVGYRYYEKKQIKPAFAFGHGLSYTSFDITDLRVQKNNGSDLQKLENEAVRVSVLVKNTGNMAGAEVVQCYVGDVKCSVERPVKELRAYEKVFLQPDEVKEVTLSLPVQAFAYYAEEKHDFVVESGEFVIFVGNASDNCKLSEMVTL